MTTENNNVFASKYLSNILNVPPITSYVSSNMAAVKITEPTVFASDLCLKTTDMTYSLMPKAIDCMKAPDVASLMSQQYDIAKSLQYPHLLVESVPFASEITAIPKSTIEEKLSNIHEPLSNLEKRVFELELNDERKDIVIQELRAKLERRRKRSKTKSKSSERVKLNKRITELEKTFSHYEPDLKFMKDMHKEEAKDTTRE